MHKIILLIGASLLLVGSFVNKSDAWMVGGLVLMWIGVAIK